MVSTPLGSIFSMCLKGRVGNLALGDPTANLSGSLNPARSRLKEWKGSRFAEEFNLNDSRFIDVAFPPTPSSLGEAKPGKLFITQDLECRGLSPEGPGQRQRFVCCLGSLCMSTLESSKHALTPVLPASHQSSHRLSAPSYTPKPPTAQHS